MGICHHYCGSSSQVFSYMHASMIQLCCFFSLLVAVGSTNATDELALMSFKSMVHDPTGSLASWNASSHFCNWRGVTCGHRRHPDRVVSVDLNACGLSGHISPSMGNLSFLRRLDLGSNRLQGQIPQELGYLSRLQVLNLTSNNLQGSTMAALGSCHELREIFLGTNQLQGEIPAQLSSLRKLTILDLSENDLSGEIPLSMANLSSIAYLVLVRNRLFGKIPINLGNLSTLEALALEYNSLSGGIPSSLSRLANLYLLGLGSNNLSGEVPQSIWNISSLKVFHIGNNSLFGKIPPNAFDTLPRLKRIHLYENMFLGPLPTSLANSSNLWYIELFTNSFGGIIPPLFGSMKSLQYLQLGSNYLQANEPSDWKFMVTLANCSNLQYLALDNNRFSGAFPISVSNLSISLVQLALGDTEISGNIPIGIGNLVNLEVIYLANANLTGPLPSTLGILQNLQFLSVFHNRLSGKIPSTLGNLTRMNKLSLADNDFSGKIPSSLGSMKALETLNLSYNQLMGTIPKELVSIQTLSILFDLSHNHLEGSIPYEVGNLQNLVEFHAESNRLSGEIPASFEKCNVLQDLYLQNNFLQGSVPSLSNGLRGLQNLDLSHNNLSGHLPEFLKDFPNLSYLNLSFNNFVGDVPIVGVFANASAISIQGNHGLCGGIPILHLPPCTSQSIRRKHRFPVIPVVISFATMLFVFLLLLFIYALCIRKPRKHHPNSASFRGHVTMTYLEIVKATGGFANSNLIGVGSYGSVYKGALHGERDDSANLVAVKVLNLQVRGAAKSFIKECEAIRNLRHRNLVKIITVCSSIDFRGNDFKAIVFEFMRNGNLEDWLHPKVDFETNTRCLDLLQRVNIAFDVALALDYLHHHGVAPVIHCDLKPSNVLLDQDMVAHVGDFGIARILAEENLCMPNSTTSLGLQGTIGYSAPEYGTGNIASTYGDIYSYGVLFLEMMTGRRPTDSNFKDGTSLAKFVEMALPDKVMDVVDRTLVLKQENNVASITNESYKENEIKCITSLLKIGLGCCDELPTNRLSSKHIINELHIIREASLCVEQEGPIM